MLDHMMAVKKLAGVTNIIFLVDKVFRQWYKYISTENFLVKEVNMSESYSIQMLKCSAFEHELRNVLDIMPLDQQDEEVVAVKNYLTKRMLELKN